MNQGKRPPEGPVATPSSPSAQRRALLALAERYKVPAFDLQAAHFALGGLGFVPREIAERHVLLPVQLRADELFVAMADPTKTRVIEELAFVSGRHIHVYVADPIALRVVIDEAYRMYADGETHYTGPRATKGTTPSVLLQVAAPAAAARELARSALIAPSPSLDDDELPSVLAFDEIEMTNPRVSAYRDPEPPRPPAPALQTSAGEREDLGIIEELDGELDDAGSDFEDDVLTEGHAIGAATTPPPGFDDLRVQPEGSLSIHFGTLVEALNEDEDESESALPAPQMDPHLSLAIDVRTLSKMLRIGRSDPPPPPPPPPVSARRSAVPEADEDFEADLAFSPRGTVKTVLVADVDTEARALLRRVLGDRGYRVIEAASGSSALGLVQNDTPDAMIIEAVLPGVHGFEVCRRIKGSERYGHLPIVMISGEYRGWRYAADLESAYRVSAFLEKPFRVWELVGALERALAGDRAPRRDVEEPLSPDAEQALAASMERVRAGDQDAAVAELEKGVQVDPKAFRLHYSLALLAGRRGDVFRAIRALEAAIELQPRSFAALKNLAVLYQQAGLRRKASELWERAREHSPDEATRAQVEAHLLGLLRTPAQ